MSLNFPANLTSNIDLAYSYLALICFAEKDLKNQCASPEVLYLIRRHVQYMQQVYAVIKMCI